MTPPLTAARLAEIRERHDVHDGRARHARKIDVRLPVAEAEAHADRGALLAEVDRLTAALATVEGERLQLARATLWCHTESHWYDHEVDELHAAQDVARRIVDAAEGRGGGDG